MDYERDKKIDLNNLHYERMMQIQLTHDYEEEVARAKNAVDEADEAVEVEKALAGDRAREKLSSAGKYTVDMVKDAVTLDKGLQIKKEELQKASLNLGLVKAGAKAMDVRKSALEGLVELYKREYFATPHEAKNYDEWTQKRFTEDTAKVLRDKANNNAREAARTRTRTNTTGNDYVPQGQSRPITRGKG
jgi:hypothetical protein